MFICRQILCLYVSNFSGFLKNPTQAKGSHAWLITTTSFGLVKVLLVDHLQTLHFHANNPTHCKQKSLQLFLEVRIVNTRWIAATIELYLKIRELRKQKYYTVIYGCWYHCTKTAVTKQMDRTFQLWSSEVAGKLNLKVQALMNCPMNCLCLVTMNIIIRLWISLTALSCSSCIFVGREYHFDELSDELFVSGYHEYHHKAMNLTNSLVHAYL